MRFDFVSLTPSVRKVAQVGGARTRNGPFDVDPEIARIRGVEAGKTVFSPPAHSAFATPVGLREQIRIIASGKILTGFHMVRALALGASDPAPSGDAPRH